MGRSKRRLSGLHFRLGVWHIDKVINGTRLRKHWHKRLSGSPGVASTSHGCQPASNIDQHPGQSIIPAESDRIDGAPGACPNTQSTS